LGFIVIIVVVANYWNSKTFNFRNFCYYFKLSSWFQLNVLCKMEKLFEKFSKKKKTCDDDDDDDDDGDDS